MFLVVGAGGTGKSAMVHALEREFVRLGLGKLLITAYTGVAAAPFGGPTLMSLLKMSLKTKKDLAVREMDAAERTRARDKWKAECGTAVEEVGGLVIDEVSFIELGVFGHLDKDLRTLLGASGVLCGG